jgi:PAS fold
LPPEASPAPRAARGERFTMNMSLRTKAGALRPFEVEARPLINDQGENIGGVIIMREVVARPAAPSQEPA